MGAGTGTGRIVIVGTPIGNLGDLSPRAAAALAGAGVICCEDTRRTRKLLSAAGIPAPRLVALHAHNEAAGAEQAVALAAGGATVAVVSDAGMPGISDPGERVVRAAVAAGVAVEVVPGPSALVAAVVLSGLPAERFCFEGFLPRKGGQRAARLAALAAAPCTSVIYEAPGRVAGTLKDLIAACGEDRAVAVVREITKVHEEVRRGTLGSVSAALAGTEARGEWVVVLGGATAAPAGEVAILEALQARMAAGESRRDAADAVAAQTGAGRRRVYQLALQVEPRIRS